MATLQGVMDALTAAIRTAVNPLSLPYVCYSGWPTQAALQGEVAKGTRSHIAVYDLGVEHRTDRFLPDTQSINAQAVNLTATISGGSVTFGGTPSAGLNIGISLGGGSAIVYQTTSSDTTTALVAQHVASAINSANQAGASAGASGSTVNTSNDTIAVHIGAATTLSTAYEQSEREFMVVVWAPSDAARDSLAEAIRASFASTYFLSLGDGFDGKLRYARGASYEPQFNAHAFRRDLVYAVEFNATQTATGYTIVGTQQSFGQL